MKNFCCYFLMLFSLALATHSEEQSPTDPTKFITEPVKIPYKRPLGFTLNLGAISSMTFEGRFIVGLAPHLTLVLSPMFQNTVDFPYFLPNEPADTQLQFFSVRRANLGIGVRGNFYDYDSLDHWYLEGMGRAGFAWVNEDHYVYSLIPSLMVGRTKVYGGYTLSFGMGLEWEFLVGDKEKMGEDTKKLKSSLLAMTKYPLTAELSIGWTW